MLASLWSVPIPQTPWPHPNGQQITSDIPDGANPDHYLRIESPRRRAVANDITVTLRKNKRFSALVELSYVRLDCVWEVLFAILSVVLRKGMQLMLRAVSMEKIMRFYSKWGWDQAWAGTYRSLTEYHQWAEYCQSTRQPGQILNDLASSGTMEQIGDAEDKPTARSDGAGSWDSTYRPDEEEDGHSEEGASTHPWQEMVYAGHAHCAALAKLLQEAQ